jgi:hypothetical protein
VGLAAGELFGEGEVGFSSLGLAIGLAAELFGEGEVGFSSVGLAVGLAAAELVGEGDAGFSSGFPVGLKAGTLLRSAV